MTLKMKTSDYERLINKGFRIYKVDKKKIWIRNKKGWSIVCDYSEARWSEILNKENTIRDDD